MHAVYLLDDSTLLTVEYHRVVSFYRENRAGEYDMDERRTNPILN